MGWALNDDGDWVNLDGDYEGMEQQWHPSTDIAQAWQVALAVCRRLDSDPYNGWVDVSDDGKAEVNSACAKFWGKGDQLVLEYGRTVPEAICLAALKAVGG